jgi:hypothetical protein
MAMDLVASAVKAQGLSVYWSVASDQARDQSRISYYLSIFFFMLPYLIESTALRAALIVGFHLLSVISLAAFLAFYTDCLSAILFINLVYCFLPHWWGYYPVAALPIAFHAPIALFFLGMLAYLVARRHAPPSRIRMILHILSAGLIFLSLFFYEALALPFLAISIAAAFAESGGKLPGKPEGKRFVATVRACWHVLAAFAIWAIIYAAFHHSHPTVYQGTALMRMGLGTLWKACRAAAIFTVSGLPAANFFFFHPGRMGDYSIGDPSTLGVASFICRNVSIPALLQAAILLLILMSYGSIRGSDTSAHLRRRASLGVLAVLFALIIPLPLALTPKYQEAAKSWAPYMPGYYCFLSLVVSAVMGIDILVGLVSKARISRWAVLVALSGLCCAATVLNAVASDAVNRHQQEASLKWRLVDSLCQTAFFRSLPSNAVLFAPTLWEEVHMNPSPTGLDYEGYWTNYIKGHAKQDLQVVRDRDRAAEQFRSGVPVYFGNVQQSLSRDDALLLISKITDVSPVDDRMTASSVVLVSYRDFKFEHLVFLRTVSSWDPSSVDVPGFAYDHGAFVAQVDAPPMWAGSARLQPEPGAIPARAVILLFERGFSSPENSPVAYWIWSDGPSGDGVINFENELSTPVAVRFRSIIRTHQPQKTPFDLVIQGVPETVMIADGDVLERTITLQPGRNEMTIKSHGPRIIEPSDPRYLVFGLESWTLEKLSSP